MSNLCPFALASWKHWPIPCQILLSLLFFFSRPPFQAVELELISSGRVLLCLAKSCPGWDVLTLSPGKQPLMDTFNLLTFSLRFFCEEKTRETLPI